MFDTRNDYQLNFMFLFMEKKILHKFQSFAHTTRKTKRNLQKFRNIHSNSSTSPSHRHEGLNNKNQTSPPESSGNKPGRASDLCYRTFFLRGKLIAKASRLHSDLNNQNTKENEKQAKTHQCYSSEPVYSPQDKLLQREFFFQQK